MSYVVVVNIVQASVFRQQTGLGGGGVQVPGAAFLHCPDIVPTLTWSQAGVAGGDTAHTTKQHTLEQQQNKRTL